MLEATSSGCTSPARSGGESSSGVGTGRGNLGDGYGSPGSQRSQPDWSIVDQLFDSPHLIYGILVGRCSKEMKELVKNANEDIKFHFSKQVFDILVQTIKTSLGLIRRRFLGSKGSIGSSMFHSGVYMLYVTVRKIKLK